MKLYHSISEYHNKKGSVITIGTFDGVHIGHNKIIQRLASEAKTKDLDSLILTFFPHPRMVLQKESDIKLINTIDERIEIFSQTDLDQLIIHPFTEQFSRLTALEFVRDILVNKLNAKKVIIGYDHRFGRNRNADINDLKEFGKTYDFEVEEISAEQLNEVSVSSTKIRTALEDGQIKKANRYLGYPFMISGTVVRGKGIGKTLEYPTANLEVKENYKIVPGNGVYIVRSLLDGELVHGITSIGTNPTVGGTARTIETYFLNTEGDLYGIKIRLEILARIRDEIKFSSMEALRKAIKADESFAHSYLEKHHGR